MRKIVFLPLFFSLLWACTDPATPNNSTQNNVNNETCVRGDRRCLDDRTLVTCLDGTQETTTQCLDDEICEQNDCIERDSDCEDTCQRPATRCTVDGTVETCNDHNNDGCDEFGDPVACDPGLFCDPEDGLCKPSDCSDVCTEGETSCEEDLITTCFRSPRGCLEFGVGKECPDGDVCSAGNCVPPGACSDECTLGEGTCTADGMFRACETNAEGCEVLIAAVNCPANQECRTGECLPERNCVDQCIAGERVCVANDLATCEVQADGCLAFSNPTTCPNGQTCSSQNGTPQCVNVAVSGSVVINEVFYDAVGDDVRGSGASAESPTFIELFGPAGLDISGYTIELVNGSGGAVYGSFTLPAGTILDGRGFAVITSDEPDVLMALVLPFFTNVYYELSSSQSGQDPMQNGADNVVLRDDNNAIEDAVAYGNSSNFFFAGEGSCATQATCENAPDAISGRSIGRIGQGQDSDNNQTDFFTFYPTPGFENSDLIINEIYFNEPGTDTGAETFIELMSPITGWEDMPLDGYTIRAINGFNGDDYIFTGALPGIDFSGSDLNQAGDDGYVVICNIDTANNALLSICSVPYEGVDFQNGPDNFTLLYESRIVDAVGYGSFSGANVFVGEGEAKPFSGSNAGKALSRWPITDPSRSLDTDNNRDDFHVVDPSPGTVNPLPQ